MLSYLNFCRPPEAAQLPFARTNGVARPARCSRGSSARYYSLGNDQTERERSTVVYFEMCVILMKTSDCSVYFRNDVLFFDIKSAVLNELEQIQKLSPRLFLIMEPSKERSPYGPFFFFWGGGGPARRSPKG